MNDILVAGDTNEAKRLSSLYRANKLRRIHQGIYTDNLHDPLEDIVARKWLDILPLIVTEGILSFRTAMNLRPTPFKNQLIVFMTSSYTKTITLPGLIIKVYKGNYQSYLEQISPKLARSNVARMLLENLTSIKSAAYKGIKTVDVEDIENFLATELRIRDEKSLNQIRDEAKIIAEDLNLVSEYKNLNQIIASLLATNPVDKNVLNSNYAKAVAKKEPFDSRRISLFENFVLYLKKSALETRKYQYSKTSFRNLTFFETYFSNYIEGTKFVIDEAEDIVFRGNEINHRHADSHDVLSNFTISNDFSEMNIQPKNINELLDILQTRHAYIMKERPEKRPGKFKKIPNHAGRTYFVEPEEVIGTLTNGFELYNLLNDSFQKALFMHLLISEVHPFDDGNGRLSRIMMNAELVSNGLFKIIIPTVQRDNYLNGLRLVSRDNDFRIYCKIMDQCQAYTSNVNWSDYGQAREKIETDCANQEPDDGLPIFNRALRELKLSEFAV